eukprot:jgi/Psemu1/5185/gm1.5185_g
MTISILICLQSWYMSSGHLAYSSIPSPDTRALTTAQEMFPHTSLGTPRNNAAHSILKTSAKIHVVYIAQATVSGPSAVFNTTFIISITPEKPSHYTVPGPTSPTSPMNSPVHLICPPRSDLPSLTTAALLKPSCSQIILAPVLWPAILDVPDGSFSPWPSVIHFVSCKKSNGFSLHTQHSLFNASNWSNQGPESVSPLFMVTAYPCICAGVTASIPDTTQLPAGPPPAQPDTTPHFGVCNLLVASLLLDTSSPLQEGHPTIPSHSTHVSATASTVSSTRQEAILLFPLLTHDLLDLLHRVTNASPLPLAGFQQSAASTFLSLIGMLKPASERQHWNGGHSTTSTVTAPESNCKLDTKTCTTFSPPTRTTPAGARQPSSFVSTTASTVVLSRAKTRKSSRMRRLPLLRDILFHKRRS